MRKKVFTIAYEFYLDDGDVIDLKYTDCRDTSTTIAELIEQAVEEFDAMVHMMNLPRQKAVYKISIYPTEFDAIVNQFDQLDEEREVELEVLPELTVSDLERLYKISPDERESC